MLSDFKEGHDLKIESMVTTSMRQGVRMTRLCTEAKASTQYGNPTSSKYTCLRAGACPANKEGSKNSTVDTIRKVTRAGAGLRSSASHSPLRVEVAWIDKLCIRGMT